MIFNVTIRKMGVPDEVRSVEAQSRLQVYELLRKEDGMIIKVEEKKGGLRLPKWLFVSFGTGMKRIEIIHFAKNLSVMISAGLSLTRAIAVIERQSNNKRMKIVMSDIISSLAKGVSFHKALAEHPKIFPELLVAMTRAGEESGSLASALNVVGLQMERSEELVRKIKGAMIYPSIVISAIIIVGILMLIYVVPTLTDTFKQLGVELPFATRVVVALSDFMSANALLILSTLALVVMGGIGFVRSRAGNRIMVAIALYLPIINDLVRETYAARTARTLSSLLSSGVPVLQALSITREVVSTPQYANVIKDAEDRVQRGEVLSTAFSESKNLYPVLMSEMLAVGEETGRVAEMLGQVAEFYEADVGAKTKDLSTIIEPVLMLFIGAVVGIFAVSMISPIYSISTAL